MSTKLTSIERKPVGDEAGDWSPSGDHLGIRHTGLKLPVASY
ncbi:hypothetical protein ACSYAD_23525 [Acaryochloris marina NIES-2412]